MAAYRLIASWCASFEVRRPFSCCECLRRVTWGRGVRLVYAVEAAGRRGLEPRFRCEAC